MPDKVDFEVKDGTVVSKKEAADMPESDLPYGGLSDEEVNDLRQHATELGKAESLGVVGFLVAGRELAAMSEATDGMAPKQGVKVQQAIYDEIHGKTKDDESRFPKEGMRSKHRAAHKAWVVTGGLDIDGDYTHKDYPATLRLSGVKNASALVALNNAVTKRNALKLLAFLHNQPWAVVSKVSKHIKQDNAVQVIDSFKNKDQKEIITWAKEQQGEPTEPELKTLVMPTAVYNNFEDETALIVGQAIADVAPRTALVEWPDTDKGKKFFEKYASRSEVLEFIHVLTTDMLNPDWLRGAVQQAYGLHTPETFEAWKGQAALSATEPTQRPTDPDTTKESPSPVEGEIRPEPVGEEVPREDSIVEEDRPIEQVEDYDRSGNPAPPPVANTDGDGEEGDSEGFEAADYEYPEEAYEDDFQRQLALESQEEGEFSYN